MIKTPNNPNKLLVKQIAKAFPENKIHPDQCNIFLELVNNAYNTYDDDRILYQRAERISNTELEEINKELQSKNDFLDSFNHGMAHDIKNHSSNIIGLINMLNKYTAKGNIDMIKEITKNLESSANQLTSIVQGFLYLSRAETKIDSNYIVIDKDELIELVEVETQFLKLGKNIKINYNFELNNLFYSRHILKIILVNLVSNSIKYSKLNEDCIINIDLNYINNNIYLSVSDNGIGIDLTNAGNKLYNLFNQESASKGKGFGVGLFLIKKIIDRNNGTIELESELNVGTKVIINLPTQN